MSPLKYECSQIGNSKINIAYYMLNMSECLMKCIAHVNGWFQIECNLSLHSRLLCFFSSRKCE